jgi:hypothetical protein
MKVTLPLPWLSVAMNSTRAGVRPDIAERVLGHIRLKLSPQSRIDRKVVYPKRMLDVEDDPDLSELFGRAATEMN